MSSILTNSSAIASLKILRFVDSSLQQASTKVSSGLSVEKAADNAAYWSIATTMRSDVRAVSAVRNVLDIATNVADVAYEAMARTREVLADIRAKLVAATEAGVDKAKIQDEISQLAASTRSIAASASFNGVNLLDTDIHDLYEAFPVDRSATFPSAFVRNSDGSVSVGMTHVDQINTSLFNSEGDGILQGDPRSPKTIGGIRPYGDFSTPDIVNDYLPYYTSPGGAALISEEMPFSLIGGLESPTAIVFGIGDKISFDLTVDGDNPSQGLSAPLDPGSTAFNVSIDAAMVNSLGGAIHNATEMAAMLNTAFAAKGMGALVYASPVWRTPLDAPAYPDPVRYTIVTTEASGLKGSQVQISNFSSTVATGSLADKNAYGTLGSSFNLTFAPFKIYRDVSIDFTFGVNGEPTETHTINRSTVNAILGTTDGWINTADDMVTILKSLITRPNTIIETNGSAITIRSDPLDDRLNGAKSKIGFTNISVNVEPIPMNGLMDIDIAKYPGSVNASLYSVDAMLIRVTNGAAALGVLRTRLDKQADFADRLVDDLRSGIGRLVDADMEEISSKLAALQTQQQLASQALSIANEAPRALLSLLG